MQNAAAMLYCPNPTCQAANSEDHKFCQKCSTPLPRHYLWALGEGSSVYQTGDLVIDRYLCKQPSVFLDTKPGLLSNTYQELPEPLLPYLRLVSFQLHTPQIYDWIPGNGAATAGLTLLDRVPLYGSYSATESQSPTAQNPNLELQLFPTLTSQWQQASALRQLNWLWQIANLWQPFSGEKVVASLLDAELMRVEGSLLRLLELRPDVEPFTLADLGQFWLQWANTAQPQITGFLTKLCQGLIQGQIHNAELLVSYLDAVIAQLSQAQTRQMQIVTLSDQGPTRQRNEDACYPASGTQTPEITDNGLLIVCDGIGGHQGGDVASQLAITTLEQRLKALRLDQLDSVTLSIELEKATCTANDQISQRNDSEHRFDRQRMGTTLVMALARAHELYITHVGDSRAYWITRQGCHQITLDDDVASREVRLGYSFYRQAMHQPSAGSLVQALGMGASSMLYPTVQRFIPDEDSIFLLCSDGLSDNDRVEETWESEILPLLDGKTDLTTISQRLVEIGNVRNGYDNVTVGLIHYRVAVTHPIPTVTELPSVQLPGTTQPASANFADDIDPETQQTELVGAALDEPITASFDSTQPTKVVTPSAKFNFLPWIMAGIALVGLGGLLAALLPSLFQSNTSTLPPVLDTAPDATPSDAAPQVRDPSASNPETPIALEVGTLIQLSRLPQVKGADSPLLVSRPQPQTDSANPTPSPTATSASTPKITTETIGLIPIGTVLEVLRKQSLSQEESWVELRVCSTTAGDSPETASPLASPPASSTPSPASTQIPVLQTGQTGWIRETEILPLVSVKTNLTTEQQQACS